MVGQPLYSIYREDKTMLGDIKSARKLLSGLDADDMENLSECIKAQSEVAALADSASELSDSLTTRIEYLKTAGQTVDEEEDPENNEAGMSL